TLAADIDAGRVRTVIVVNEDLLAAGLSRAQLEKVTVIYVGTHANPTSEAAKVVIPTLTIFEKNGTYVNQQFRIQKFARAVPGPAGTTDDLDVLSRLIAGTGGGSLGNTVGTVWTALAAEIPALAGLSYAKIPDTGHLIDGSACASLPYLEGNSLHYKPAALAAASASPEPPRRTPTRFTPTWISSSHFPHGCRWPRSASP